MKNLLTKIALLLIVISFGTKAVASFVDRKDKILQKKTNRNIDLAGKEKVRKKNLKKLLILGGTFIGAVVTRKALEGETIIERLQGLIILSFLGGLTGAVLKRDKEKAFEGMIVSGTSTAIGAMFFSMLARAIGKKSLDAVLHKEISSNNNTVPIGDAVSGAIMSGGLGAITGKVLNNDGLTGGSVTAIATLLQVLAINYLYKE